MQNKGNLKNTKKRMNNTEFAISLLAKDSKAIAPVSHLVLFRTFCLPLILGAIGVIVLGWFLSIYTNMPMRADYLHSITNPFVFSKQLLPLLVCLGAITMLRQAYFPQTTTIKVHWSIWVALGTLAILVIYTLLSVNIQQWHSLWMGKTPVLSCFVTISIMSLPLTWALFEIMRHGATTKPRLSGLLLGINASCIATLLYAFICTEDSPLYYGSWYLLAILSLGGISSALAPKLLRW